MTYEQTELFGVRDKVAVVTGGGGVLCGEMALALGALGARVAILDLHLDRAKERAAEIEQGGGTAIGLACDVLDPDCLSGAAAEVVKTLGAPDILVNGAGGNHKSATTGGTTIAEAIAPTFFELDPEAVKFVFNLNFLGTLLPTQAFANAMADRGGGTVVNITSMNAFTPLTKIPAYSAAKAAVGNFTQWLAVHFAPAGLRVNAIAPGFFLTEQNRFLLTDEKTGQPTPRGKTIIDHTPMGRYGDPKELIGALLYLVSPASAFVTGTTVAVDGGFAAFSGV